MAKKLFKGFQRQSQKPHNMLKHSEWGLQSQSLETYRYYINTYVGINKPQSNVIFKM